MAEMEDDPERHKNRAHPDALLERLALDTLFVAGAALRALQLLEVPAAKIAARLDARADAGEARLAFAHWAEVKAVG
jgi:hypothetical protein